MLDLLLSAAITLGAISALMYVMGRPSRYKHMTDREFEEDTKQGPGLGAAIIGMERALRRREADFVIEQKQRVEKGATASGDKPHPESGESTGEEPES